MKSKQGIFTTYINELLEHPAYEGVNMSAKYSSIRKGMTLTGHGISVSCTKNYKFERLFYTCVKMFINELKLIMPPHKIYMMDEVIENWFNHDKVRTNGSIIETPHKYDDMENIKVVVDGNNSLIFNKNSDTNVIKINTDEEKTQLLKCSVENFTMLKYDNNADYIKEAMKYLGFGKRLTAFLVFIIRIFGKTK